MSNVDAAATNTPIAYIGTNPCEIGAPSAPLMYDTVDAVGAVALSLAALLNVVETALRTLLNDTARIAYV